MPIAMKDAEAEFLSIGALRVEWDERTRQGIDLVAKFKKTGTAFPLLIDSIQARRKSRRRARKKLASAIASGFKAKRATKRARKASKKHDKSISHYLKSVQAEMIAPGFALAVVAGPLPKPGSKQTYRLMSSSYDAAYFAGRVLSRDIRRAFGVKPIGRNEVVRALVSILAGKWPKTIVRADVDSFYETVPHDRLIELLDENHLLSPLSKNWVRQMLSSYANLTTPSSPIGIPRGVGPSAALADAYLLTLDRQIRDRKECVFYGRYVDDIVAVMAPMEPRDALLGGYLSEIEGGLKTLGLSLSSKPDKRIEEAVSSSGSSSIATFEFLGYKIVHDAASGGVDLDVSRARSKRIEMRLDRTFGIYLRSHSKEGNSARLLELRLRFLTGNTRLANSKKDAFVGVKFSNPLLTSSKTLKKLDWALKRHIVALPTSTPLGVLDRIKKHGFERGFADVTYVRFSDQDWRQIVSAWRDIA
jgi:hypothetical protein